MHAVNLVPPPTLPMLLLLMLLLMLLLQAQSIPVLDVGSLYDEAGRDHLDPSLLSMLRRSLTDVGFFYARGVPLRQGLVEELVAESRLFFGQSTEEKNHIRMEKAGSAWRGYFAVGSELTSGLPDEKEGIYLSTDSDAAAGPLRGLNQYPLMGDRVLLKALVEEYMAAMRGLCQRLMRAIYVVLGAPGAPPIESFANPVELLRIFNYPPHNSSAYPRSQGVGEHTDYGFLTVLYQDSSGGLQARDSSTNEWIPVPPLDDAFVVNIGDALERLSRGALRATPHRVERRNQPSAVAGRISIPYFFDPSMNSPMASAEYALPPDLLEAVGRRAAVDAASGSSYTRWDKKDVHKFHGTYGQYLLEKVSQVFPELFATIDGSSREL